MRFVETPLFTAQVSVIGDAALRELQIFLSERPEAGAIIQGTGGLRKVRVKLAGRGKSGGARCIYLLLPKRPVIALFFLYAKNRQTDLSPNEKRMLRESAEKLKAHQHLIP